MTNKEIMLECFKIGLALTSSTVSDRRKEVAIAAKEIYDSIIAVDIPQLDTPKRGRPPKLQAE